MPRVAIQEILRVGWCFIMACTLRRARTVGKTDGRSEIKPLCPRSRTTSERIRDHTLSPEQPWNAWDRRKSKEQLQTAGEATHASWTAKPNHQTILRVNSIRHYQIYPPRKPRSNLRMAENRVHGGEVAAQVQSPRPTTMRKRRMCTTTMDTALPAVSSNRVLVDHAVARIRQQHPLGSDHR